WSGGRSTNKSRVVVSVTVRLGRRTWTGFRTPVTPTLLSRNEFVTFSPCTSFGIGSTLGGLRYRRLKSCPSHFGIRCPVRPSLSGLQVEPTDQVLRTFLAISACRALHRLRIAIQATLETANPPNKTNAASQT